MTNTLELSPQAFSKQSHQFWAIQIGGWIGYALFVFLAIIRPQFEQADFNFSGQMLNLALETFCGFGLSYLQWLFIQRIVHLPLRTTIFLSFLSAAILGIIFNVQKLATYKVLVYGQRWNESWNMLEFGGWLLFSLATMFVWTSIFFIMLYNAKLQREHEQLLRAETAAKDAQLQMLRYQLNPHFMFNTMNVISTLIFKQDNERANEMLDKLCEFFRYSLDQTDKTTTTLDKELELLELYISIEKVRFGNRLEVEIDIDDDALKGRVPYMLLQPIVENSIKHAIEPRKDGGCIVIQVRTNGNRLKLLITDQGKTPGTVRRQGFGIGMSNTRARLDAMFGGDFQFSINDDQRGGTSVVIDIPLHRERDTYYRSAS